LQHVGTIARKSRKKSTRAELMLIMRYRYRYR